MRVLIVVLVLSLAGCAATTASERAGQSAAITALDVMIGIMSLATGDLVGAGLAFGSAGVGVGLTAVEAQGLGAPPAEQTPASPDR